MPTATTKKFYPKRCTPTIYNQNKIIKNLTQIKVLKKLSTTNSLQI